MERPKLLFVDDEDSIRETLPAILTMEGFDVTAVATVQEAIAEISSRPFDILLSDLNIGEPSDGFIVVGAMRKIQPAARTYILTGYPDISSALEALRRQVDDYLIKPADIPMLLKTLRTKKPRGGELAGPGKLASTVIRENAAAILERWVAETEMAPELMQVRLFRSARIDHLPKLLGHLANRLDKNRDFSARDETESALAHGRTRRQQGYTIPQVMAESRILFRVIAEIMQNNVAEMDVGFIIPDLILINEVLSEMLTESLRSFLSPEPIIA